MIQIEHDAIARPHKDCSAKCGCLAMRDALISNSVAKQSKLTQAIVVCLPKCSQQGKKWFGAGRAGATQKIPRVALPCQSCVLSKVSRKHHFGIRQRTGKTGSWGR